MLFRSDSTYNPTIYFVVSLLALLVNVAVLVYMLYKMRKTRRNPYAGELYTDLAEYVKISELAEPKRSIA